MTSLPNRPEVRPSTSPTTTVQQWLAQGDALYQSAIQECQAMETQLEELERRFAARQLELNQLAAVLHKPAWEGRRAVSASSHGHVSAEEQERLAPAAQSNAAIARTLAGKLVRTPPAVPVNGGNGQ